MVIPIPGLTRAVIQAVNVGRSISTDIRAVYISEDPDAAAAMRTSWERQVPGVPLVVVESPYRALIGPLLAYLDVLDRAWPPDKPEPITFIVIRSTLPGTGGSESCTTSRPSGCGRSSSAGPTPSSSAPPTGARKRAGSIRRCLKAPTEP